MSVPDNDGAWLSDHAVLFLLTTSGRMNPHRGQASGATKSVVGIPRCKIQIFNTRILLSGKQPASSGFNRDWHLGTYPYRVSFIMDLGDRFLAVSKQAPRSRCFRLS